MPYLNDVPYSRGGTSKEAAASQLANVATVRGRVRNYIDESGGVTCDELELALNLAHQTASARIRDLAMVGQIEDSKLRRPTRRGRNAIVWIVPPPGTQRILL